eukprot:196332-Hanusia_phi.AAC.2
MGAGESRGLSERMFLMYDGIHYDVVLERLGEREVTLFPADDLEVSLVIPCESLTDQQAEELALALVKTFHDKRQYTDTSNFSLRCLVCGQGLHGSEGAQKHAAETGHGNFAEN